MKSRLKDILSLTVAERVQLVEDIWDSIAAKPDEIPVSATLKRELERRRRRHKRNPGEARPWAEIKARLQGRG